MDYEEIIALVVKIVAALVSILITTLVPKIKKYFEDKIEAEKLSKLQKYIMIFVEAAEQCLKEDDPTGEKRKAYVIEQLLKLGYEVSEELDSMIEAEVFELNSFQE